MTTLFQQPPFDGGRTTHNCCSRYFPLQPSINIEFVGCSRASLTAILSAWFSLFATHLTIYTFTRIAVSPYTFVPGCCSTTHRAVGILFLFKRDHPVTHLTILGVCIILIPDLFTKGFPPVIHCLLMSNRSSHNIVAKAPCEESHPPLRFTRALF
jgi:hypothetical protein